MPSLLLHRKLGKILTSKLGGYIMRMQRKLGILKGALNMNREDILEKSRNEKNDEGIIFALNEGYKYGVGIFSIVYIFILILALVKWRTTDICLLMTVFFGLYTGILCGYQKATNKKKYFMTIFCAVLTIIFLISYVKQILF